ncbi:hypothetical protein RA307_31070 [Xanthobacteraceae bacterium Astr-EGSB]|uniref:hypothetical protein n=1 Tax=Astrobacterium formosum TaxID=3069710 RepID=UPI0027AF62F9|nr:hypothetical protein [Xanthobacteraceae bacterium Astr-EGSB]
MDNDLRIDDAAYQRGLDICATGGTLRTLIGEVVASNDDELAISLTLGFFDGLIAELRRPRAVVNIDGLSRSDPPRPSVQPVTAPYDPTASGRPPRPTR